MAMEQGTGLERESEPRAKRPRLESGGEGGGESASDCSGSATRGETLATAGRSLQEEDVGITEYISTHDGFFGILKRRYADFVVCEVAEDGTIAHLTDLAVPQEKTLSDVCGPLTAGPGIVLPHSLPLSLPPSLPPSLTPSLPPQPAGSTLEEVISSEEIALLVKLTEAGSDSDAITSVDLKAGGDKERRALIHRAVRERFPGLESATMEAGEEGGGKEDRVIRVTRRAPDKGRNRSWPCGRPHFLRFVLYKENRDTMDAVNWLSRRLHIKTATFHYAGTKDRRAVTTQWVTAFKLTAERLVSAVGSGSCIRVGNFQYVKTSLKLGNLSGNRFTIILRNLSVPDDRVIDTAASSLRDVGFINYFGMQRFGTSSVGTHEIGKCLLHSDWQGAVDLILKPRPGDSAEMSSARQYYWMSKDAAGALPKFPRWCVEAQLLKGLQSRGTLNDLLGSLYFIPRNMRVMYVHSYQSFIWNTLASWRVRECGLTPVVGDLVWSKQGDEREQDKKNAKVEYVTEENLTSYSVHDVVLPLPGFDVLFPSNRVGEMYKSLLQDDGLSLEHLKHRVKDFALPGGYRSLIMQPMDMKWELLYYDDVVVPLTRSDLDILEGKSPPVCLEGGRHRALKVEFTLPPSTYATMAVRELLKMDTSSRYQARLNSADEPTSADCSESLDTDCTVEPTEHAETKCTHTV